MDWENDDLPEGICRLAPKGKTVLKPTDTFRISLKAEKQYYISFGLTGTYAVQRLHGTDMYSVVNMKDNVADDFFKDLPNAIKCCNDLSDYVNLMQEAEDAYEEHTRIY